MYRLLADLTLVLHLLFVLFVIFGGLLVLYRPRLVVFHLPAALWGAAVEFAAWFCPLTPLENYFREKSGAAGYRAGFIEQYLLPLIYPGELTREVQVALGAAVLVMNGLVYGLVLIRLSRQRGRRKKKLCRWDLVVSIGRENETVHLLCSPNKDAIAKTRIDHRGHRIGFFGCAPCALCGGKKTQRRARNPTPGCGALKGMCWRPGCCCSGLGKNGTGTGHFFASRSS